ncbi:uncharacterized protein CXorf65 homolog [Octopus bimaculoides]|uniref:Uncharacterized protein n=1 Tax=Octopus bimaculoides TaxID=37653 RepID=A0A0L8HVC9_OCTBM|nr:uncharacterized protein CXorf65 homolog [Octopus bimaculoides]|eukprot:XP_014769097.1 PREDICTED: uncharacterized protein CXorf65 homolog isoform X2 [Octopus bimaculoides]
MFVSVLHCQNEIIYLNGNCRAKTIKEYLRRKCPLIISKVVDLIDTVGKLLHLSWISDITNAKMLFQDQTLYILVILKTRPDLKDAFHIVPVLDNWQTLYPELVKSIKAPIMIGPQREILKSKLQGKKAKHAAARRDKLLF